jgi:flagellar biogenesis protein FliO
MLSGFSGLNSNKNIRVIETSMLGNRQFLVLAECMNRKVLLGVGPGFITKLSEFSSDHSEFENSFNKELQDLEKSE